MGPFITLSLLTIFVTCLASSSDAEDNVQRIHMVKREVYLPPLVPPYSNEELEKRQIMGTPRMGKDLDEAEELEAEMSMPLYSHYLAEKEARMGAKREKRAVPLPRLGLAQRAVPLPRLGEMDEMDMEERAVPLPRLGLLVDKRLPRYGLRAVPLPRLGLQEEDMLNEEEKRAGMSMLRMGKRQMSMLRMGKRDMDEEKRGMSMLRMGKREMGEEDKRGMSMLRMGKRDDEKRSMSMLRMGRSDSDDKRAMGMLRMG